MSEGEAHAACLDFDLSCMWFGRWVDARREATVKRPRPKKQKDEIQVPKYSTLAEYLGIVEGTDEWKEPVARDASPVPDATLDTLRRLDGDDLLAAIDALR